TTERCRPAGGNTVEGEIRSYGAAARNLTNRDPRYVAHRRSMMGTGLAVLGIGLVVIALIIAATAII
ncbi:MAG: hypothetical protein WEB78_02955, partial [Ilumatobacteraceae bacterium]